MYQWLTFGCKLHQEKGRKWKAWFILTFKIDTNVDNNQSAWDQPCYKQSLCICNLQIVIIYYQNHVCDRRKKGTPSGYLLQRIKPSTSAFYCV